MHVTQCDGHTSATENVDYIPSGIHIVMAPAAVLGLHTVRDAGRTSDSSVLDTLRTSRLLGGDAIRNHTPSDIDVVPTAAHSDRGARLDTHCTPSDNVGDALGGCVSRRRLVTVG